ncbi:MAG: aldo/keto reductase [Clostridia bacterium]|nr:aldo/keto reductase [Clostridia bacterium]
MIYKEFKGKMLSTLGFGTMRLPTIDGDISKIDQEQVNKMFDVALENGVNYFDTAWGYHNGMSEIAVGKALRRHKRQDFYLASKFPGYDVSNFGKTKEIFEKQLEKCGVDYFDFYLIHNVCEKNIEQYLDRSYGTVDYLLEEKAKGRIKHLGFSTHADYNNFLRFMDAYGEHMEFCQIQLNYIDYEFQDAKLKVEYLNSKNIPIWVMEPLRGGKLANIGGEILNDIKNIRNDASPCEFAFRFLQSFDGVTVTLSGMSNMEQALDNIKTFEVYKPLNEIEFNSALSLARKMTSSVPCTSCRYCTEYCPQGLDIPKLISLYNEHVFTGGGFIAPMYVSTLSDDKKPSACVGCRSCEAVCPQNIKISEIMSNFTVRLGAK